MSLSIPCRGNKVFDVMEWFMPGYLHTWYSILLASLFLRGIKKNKPMNSRLCVRYKVFFLRSKIFIVFISKKEDDTAPTFL